MKSVLQPQNLINEEIITKNTQLLPGGRGELPPVYKTFIEHTEAYRVLIYSWEERKKETGNWKAKENNLANPSYPSRMQDCTEALLNGVNDLLHSIWRRLWLFWESDTEKVPDVCRQ
jgi:hypothetical protein